MDGAGAWRAGIVGCGRIGCTFDDDPRRGYVSTHAGAYTRTPGVDLVALADVDAGRVDRCGEKFGVPGRYQDYRDMLAGEGLDILSICTWNDTHRQVVDDAVTAGVKAIFCEKPIADTLLAADAMVHRCKDAGVILMIDHQRRFDRFHREVASYLRSGGLGRIQQVTCYYTAGIANTGSHLVDLLRFFFGDVRAVEGRYSRNLSPNPRDPNVDGLLEFEGGTSAVIQACDVEGYTIFEVNVLGTGGRLRITSHGFDVSYEEARESSRFAGYRELTPALPPVRQDPRPEFMLQAVAHLLECLHDKRTPLCSGEDGRAALEIVCALQESADRRGAVVSLPLQESVVTISPR